jgi:hypothetical protein
VFFFLNSTDWMRLNMATSFRRLRGRLILFVAILTPNIAIPVSYAFQVSQDQAKTTAGAVGKIESSSVNEPTFAEYRGLRIGITATEVRQKLGKPKIKDRAQDFFVLTENESAQIFYDEQEKVYAISIDFSGRNNNAPTPRDVLGEEITPRADGFVYARKQYADAGYWVSYNRTSGDPPQITITMQKIPG